jgi:hypothetical protein
VGDDGFRTGEDQALVTVVGPADQEGGPAVFSADLNYQGIAIAAADMACPEHQVVAYVRHQLRAFLSHATESAPMGAPGDPSKDPLSGGRAAPVVRPSP